MLKAKIVLISALVSCALVSGCKDDKKSSVAIEFMHSSVEQERQAVIAKLIERFEKENPGNDLVMGYCNMLNSILEVYYDCFAFFQYTSPQKNPYLASAFYTIVLETIENLLTILLEEIFIKHKFYELNK